MIKKIITSAALVAAGTALASAGTVLSGVTASAGDTLGTLGLTGNYDSASYDWCVSFTIDTTEKSSEGFAVYVLDSSVKDNTNDAGLEILANTGNGRLNISNSNSVHLGTPDSNGDAVFDTSSDTLDLSLSWDATYQTLTLSTTTTTDGSTYSTVLQLGEDATHSGYTQYAILSEDSTFRVAATNITVSVTSISDVPEPSMFGLLAGLGAIGLVATRRRRNRKA